MGTWFAVEREVAEMEFDMLPHLSATADEKECTQTILGLSPQQWQEMTPEQTARMAQVLHDILTRASQSRTGTHKY